MYYEIYARQEAAMKKELLQTLQKLLYFELKKYVLHVVTSFSRNFLNVLMEKADWLL